MVLTPNAVDKAASHRPGRAPRLPDRRLDRDDRGLAPGFTQAILRSCRRTLPTTSFASASATRNPARCSASPNRAAPLFPSSVRISTCSTDLPGFRVWQDGVLVDEPLTLERWWRNDLVTFAIGCSYSFETALSPKACGCAMSSNAPRCRCIAPISIAHRRALFTASSSYRCARSAPQTRSGRCRSRRASPRFMVLRCISAYRRRSGSRISRSRITASPSRSYRTSCRFFGRVA